MAVHNSNWLRSATSLTSDALDDTGLEVEALRGRLAIEALRSRLGPGGAGKATESDQANAKSVALTLGVGTPHAGVKSTLTQAENERILRGRDTEMELQTKITALQTELQHTRDTAERDKVTMAKRVQDAGELLGTLKREFDTVHGGLEELRLEKGRSDLAEEAARTEHAALQAEIQCLPMFTSSCPSNKFQELTHKDAVLESQQEALQRNDEKAEIMRAELLKAQAVLTQETQDLRRAIEEVSRAAETEQKVRVAAEQTAQDQHARLEAEIERLNKELSHNASLITSRGDTERVMSERCEALEADAERLRKTLMDKVSELQRDEALQRSVQEVERMKTVSFAGTDYPFFNEMALDSLSNCQIGRSTAFLQLLEHFFSPLSTAVTHGHSFLDSSQLITRNSSGATICRKMTRRRHMHI
ncbi:hypothetical protein FB45DRAFT_1060631 [Roridomyces roridus]|uniref:Uncharacterized protein n=1 Tax=Roridomyces roridus TaxID=1738132 RepID=A0AAD7BNQ7_9AGAR|nr:hypothetical protein FB45DRAFT_1060631 [Roridomyces roridus]